jgi:hypothetical protein
MSRFIVLSSFGIDTEQFPSINKYNIWNEIYTSFIFVLSYWSIYSIVTNNISSECTI